MKICLSLVHLIAISFLLPRMAFAQAELPQARIVTLNIDPEQVVVLHLRTGYVSSVRVLEEVSSVVLGDPGGFKAEHSEAEPQLVFFKTTSAKPAQTNALITTRGGHEISLSLVSQGKSDRSDRKFGNVKVVRIVSAFECGAIVNPDNLRNQIEGSNVQGLGGALFEAIAFENGKILNGRMSKYRIPRFSDVPALETVLLDRKDLPSAGAGECPMVGLAPAIANAIFHATGVRLRSLPLVFRMV